MQGEFFVATMGIIWPFTALIIFLYLHYNSRNKIRMALIESGRDASVFDREKDKMGNLKWGVVAVMAGLGLLVGNVFDAVGFNDDIAYVAPTLILVGVGLVGFYVFSAQKKAPDREDPDHDLM